jgi:hypothetical protein
MDFLCSSNERDRNLLAYAKFAFVPFLKVRKQMLSFTAIRTDTSSISKMF